MNREKQGAKPGNVLRHVRLPQQINQKEDSVMAAKPAALTHSAVAGASCPERMLLSGDVTAQPTCM